MAAGISAYGVSFDDLFDPDVTGDGPVARGLSGAGTPLRYASIAYGAKRPDVGIQNAGVDVSNLWAAKGTAAYTVTGLNGKVITASEQAASSQGNVYASAGVAILDNGTWSVTASNSRGPITLAAPITGAWLPPGASVSDYQVQFEISDSGHSARLVNNGAAAYVSCAASRSASLQLPSLAANNQTLRQATATVTIRLRRISSGAVSTTQIRLNVSTNGFA